MGLLLVQRVCLPRDESKMVTSHGKGQPSAAATDGVSW